MEVGRWGEGEAINNKTTRCRWRATALNDGAERKRKGEGKEKGRKEEREIRGTGAKRERVVKEAKEAKAVAKEAKVVAKEAKAAAIKGRAVEREIRSHAHLAASARGNSAGTLTQMAAILTTLWVLLTMSVTVTTTTTTTSKVVAAPARTMELE